MTPAWGSLLWFAAVVAAIPLVLWFLKRTPLGGAASGAAGTPRSVAVLVLGVTPQGISTLHTMAPQAQAAGSAAPPPPAFAQLLQRVRQNGAGRDAH